MISINFLNSLCGVILFIDSPSHLFTCVDIWSVGRYFRHPCCCFSSTGIFYNFFILQINKKYYLLAHKLTWLVSMERIITTRGDKNLEWWSLFQVSNLRIKLKFPLHIHEISTLWIFIFSIFTKFNWIFFFMKFWLYYFVKWMWPFSSLWGYQPHWL